MELKIRKSKELGIQVKDEIVFVHENGTEITLTIAHRGCFDETPYTPIKRYWNYHADLYNMKDTLVVRVVEQSRVVDIVDGAWKNTTSDTEMLLQSQDGGATWSTVQSVSLDGLESLSHVYA